MKVQGQNSNKKSAPNGQKLAGDDGTASITSLVPGIKNLRLRNGLEFESTRRSRFSTAGRVQCCMIMIISHRSRDRARRQSGTIDVTNARTCNFFAVSLTAFTFEFRPWTFTTGLNKKNRSDQSLWFWSAGLSPSFHFLFVASFCGAHSVFLISSITLLYYLKFFNPAKTNNPRFLSKFQTLEIAWRIVLPKADIHIKDTLPQGQESTCKNHAGDKVTLIRIFFFTQEERRNSLEENTSTWTEK